MSHWFYSVRTGIFVLLHEYDRGLASEEIAFCYAGHKTPDINGVNNPVAEQMKNIGPIPRGWWRIAGMRDGGHLGPSVMPLVPFTETNTYDRSGFYIHGNGPSGTTEYSHGCIVTLRGLGGHASSLHAREYVGHLVNNGITTLEVV